MGKDKYVARIPIGDYEVGAEIPADKAELWNKMFKDKPVVLESEFKKSSSEESEKVESVGEVEEQVSEEGIAADEGQEEAKEVKTQKKSKKSKK